MNDQTSVETLTAGEKPDCADWNASQRAREQRPNGIESLNCVRCSTRESLTKETNLRQMIPESMNYIWQNGQKVHYKPIFGQTENGIVKSQHPSGKSVWVVYRCAGDWGNYQNYTGELTVNTDLVDGWI